MLNGSLENGMLYTGLAWAEPLAGLVEHFDRNAWRSAEVPFVIDQMPPPSGNRAPSAIGVARTAPPKTSTSLNGNASRDIAVALTQLAADALVLYVKTKSFYWQMLELPFSDHHLMLQGQAAQLLGMIDAFGEHAQKIGKTALRSIGQGARLQTLKDNDAESAAPLEMLLELGDDNERLVAALRAAHDLCLAHDDVRSAALIKSSIDDAEGRIWFFSEATRTSPTQQRS
jgi:starvation-inducible DNA-binding protein